MLDYTYLNILISIALVLATVVFFLLFLQVVRRVLRALAGKLNAYHKDILSVRVPKESPRDLDKEETVQALQEDIAVGESMFSMIGGMKANPKGFKSWLLGAHNDFSFEIVAYNKLISFYVTAPRNMRRLLEQEIYARYPEAAIEDAVDYNIFTSASKPKAASLKLKRSNMFPIRTYKNMDVDPMDSIINAMAKLREGEGAAVQIIVKSAHRSWRSRAHRILKEVRKGKTLTEAIKMSGYSRIFSGASKAGNVLMQKEKGQAENIQHMTQAEEDGLKAIEEKMSKAGLDVNIKIVVSSDNEGQSQVYLDNIIDSFNQYSIFSYGNSFKKTGKLNSRALISEFIFRRFNEKNKMVLNTEELASIFHFPLPENDVPNISWLTAKKASAPADTPTEGLYLGENIFRGITKLINIKRDDRRRHTYIIGKSGTGKSNLIALMARQDIKNGEGVCVIDPHGDLIDDVMAGIPKERAEDVIYFSPADLKRPIGLNLLEYDERYPEQKTFVINEMIKIFDKLYDLRATGGPIFEQYMRNAMLLIMDDPASGSTLMEISRVLSDADFRKMKIKKCKDPTVVSFWEKEAEKAGGEAALANVVPYITSKLTSFVSNATMRPIIGQQKSSFNLRDIMNQRKILLLNLSKGQIGEMNAHLLGMVLVGKILVNALSRTDMEREKRNDFYLYIDEFQNFTTDSISIILSEARKYNLNLIMAHQYLGQLVQNNDTSIKDAVFGNVGTWVLFKIGSEDAETMVKEFTPVFNEFDLINIEKYHAYVKLLIDNTTSRPFSMAIPRLPDGNPVLAQKIKELSRLKYGRDRNIVEAEIMRRTSTSNQ
ncbi:MAG: type IV secretory system conjugative DNA transfer family protein [Patescibacteria group bacterium]|jgi:hypothetical protein